MTIYLMSLCSSALLVIPCQILLLQNPMCWNSGENVDCADVE